MGLEAVLQDERGASAPYKYVNEIRSHIKKRLRKYPDWSDKSIAEQAAADIDIAVSRRAVARILDLQRRPEKFADIASFPRIDGLSQNSTSF